MTSAPPYPRSAFYASMGFKPEDEVWGVMVPDYAHNAATLERLAKEVAEKWAIPHAPVWVFSRHHRTIGYLLGPPEKVEPRIVEEHLTVTGVGW